MPSISDLLNMPPRKAAEFLQSKSIRIGGDWHDTLAEAHDRAFTIANVLKADLLQQARDSLGKAIREGQTFAQWQKSLPQELRDLGKNRLKTIYRTNLQSAFSKGRDDWARDANIPYFEYVAVLDSVTRPTHAALSGKVFAADDPFWNHFSPPIDYRCFPAGEMVNCKPIGGSKTWYSGKIHEITTARGNRIAVTPNHPVLTKDGWVLAGDVKQGDNLVCTGRNIEAARTTSINNQNCIALVEDIFDSLALHGSAFLHSTDLDFNGDGQFCQGDIHVVGPDSFLRDIADTTGRQLLPKKSLIVSYEAKSFFSLLRKLILKVFAATPEIKNGFNDDIPDKRFIRANFLGNKTATHPLLVKLNDSISGCVPHVCRFFPPSLADDSIFAKPLFLWCRNTSRPFKLLLLGLSSLFNSSTGNKFFDSLSGAPVCFSELQEAVSREVLLDNVVRVREYDYSGHVYDFTTTDGLIVSNNIISSNCRCRKVPRSERWLARHPDKLVSSRGDLKPLLRRVGQNKIEETMVYTAKQTDGRIVDVTPGRGWARDWQPDLSKYDPDIREGLRAALDARFRAIKLPTGVEVPYNGMGRYRAESERQLGDWERTNGWVIDTETTRRGGFMVARGSASKAVNRFGRALAQGGSRVQLDGNQVIADGLTLSLVDILRIVAGGLWGLIKR